MIGDNEKSYSDVTNVTTEGSPRWVGIATVLLAAVSVLALGIAWNATTHAKGAEQKLAAQGTTIQQNADTLSQRLSQEEETNTELKNELMAVTDKLKMTQGEVTNTRKQTSQIREDYTKKLDGVQTQLDTKASSDDVKSLGGDVNGVKTDLETTKNNLQMARGEFGTLIAKNHDEIEELRRLGERDYYEFTISGKGNKTKMGTLTAELRDTNVKKNQFTMALYVDDMRLEKKNRSVDEPIYFYTRGTRAPLELVVNEISKEKITGYMSVPKQGATSASAAAVNNN
jgi:hypothetical protein